GYRYYVVGALGYNEEYAIFGNDFEIQDTAVETTSPAKEAQILEKSAIYAVRYYDNTLVNVNLTDDGGYTNIANVYTLNFEVENHPQVYGTILATVYTNYPPEIKIEPKIIALELNDTTWLQTIQPTDGIEW